MTEQPAQPDPDKARRSFYDRHLRDPDAKRFYNSAEWKRTSKAVRAEHPVCQRCGRNWSAHVHHVIPLAKCTTLAQKLDRANLLACCLPCHRILEAEGENNVAPLGVRGTLYPTEDDVYFYDEEAAEHPVRWIEKYCTHSVDDFDGTPFLLLDWQKHIVRTLFGWKRRDNGRKRFRECYLLSGKGSGKTPLLAAIGLYLFLGTRAAGAYVVSMASTFEQANHTFEEGKRYIDAHAALSKVAESKQFVIRGIGRFKNSKWKIISGKPKGRSGSAPNCVLADECHEWPAETAKSFDLLTANVFKRKDPLVIVATNAGEDRSGFAWSQYERAVGVLSGKIDDPHLLPVIYEADLTLDWRSEEAAKAANPSIGHFRNFDDIRIEQAKGEARYRRLYLSQHVSGGDKWIDSAVWESVCRDLDPSVLAGLPLYLALDASGGDDLFAAALVWVTADRYYIDARFWLPRLTAEKYAESHGIPFATWEMSGAITLLDDGPTINHTSRERIARDILDAVKPYKVQTLGYDRAWKASEVVAVLKAADMKCEPVQQAWGIYEGAKELDNRLKEKSLQIAPNPVLRWNAENVALKHDDRGNYWPMKPNAKGNYAGTRSAKVDGISALCTALTLARTHSFPKTTASVSAFIIKLK